MDNAGLERLQRFEADLKNRETSKEAASIILNAIEKAKPLMEYSKEERLAMFNNSIADHMAKVMPVTAALVETLLFGHEEGYQFRYMPTV